MGLFDWFWDILGWLGWANKSGKVLFLGLDNAGKTTLLHMLKSEKMAQLEPTMHPNVEDLTMGNISFSAIDLGGHEIARRLWKDYFTQDVSAVVFIVDTADGKRFEESRKELDGLLRSEELQKTPFLILGNKIDKEGAISEQNLIDVMGLRGMTTGKNNTTVQNIRPLEVFMCTILNQMGYREGFQWLGSFIN